MTQEYSSVLSMKAVVREHRDGPQVVRALNGVDLEVAAGEMVAITGRSGSGKSTLLNVAGGLDPVTAGEVLVEGRSLTHLDAHELAEMRRKHVGYVFQNLNLIPSLTAKENVALPLEFDRVEAKQASSMVDEALSKTGAQELADRFPDELSGGQRQRVAIARAIAGPRRLLLADEPTGALDELSGRAIMDLLAGMAQDGVAVVLVTHDNEFAAYADRIVRLRDGQVAETIKRQVVTPTALELLQ